MATERIDIIVSEKGSRVVKRNLDQIGTTAKKSAGGVDFLKRALVSLGAALSAREVIRLVDTYTNLQNRLRATGLEGNTLTAVFKELLEVSNDTRSSLEGSVELYARLAISAKDLGVSQRELLTFTKSLNQAIILSGASAIEAQAGLIQLSQGMASGTLRGDELRSVLEQLPAVADVIAKRLGITRGELRTLGEEGKITANVILDAFKAARGELEERFGRTIPTISQSFQVLQNNVIQWAGAMDAATGFSRALSGALLSVAANLDTVLKALLATATGFLVIKGGAAIVNVLTASVQGLTAAIAANPIGFLAIALTSAVAALILFKDEIDLGIDGVTTLGDLMRALGESASRAFNGIAAAAEATFGPLAATVRAFFDSVDFSVIGILRVVARGVDAYVGFWRGAIDAVVVLFKSLPAVLGDLFTQSINALLRQITDFVNKMSAALSTVTDFFGLGAIKPIDFEGITNESAGAAAQLGTDVGAAFSEGFESSNLAVGFLDDLTARAAELGTVRIAKAQSANKPVDLGGDSSGGATFSAAQKKELESLISSYDKVFAAQKEFTEGTALLDAAMAAGVISLERRAEIQTLMTEQLRDALDPLGAVNRELEREMELLGQTSDAREVSNQLRAISDDLVTQGVILGEAELAQLREKLVLLAEETKLSAARDAILQSTLGTQQDFTTQLQAINQLMAEGLITQGQATAFLVEQNSTLLEGTIEAQEAWVQQYNDTYLRIDELREADLISEQTATQLKLKANAELNAKQLQNAQSFFGALAGLAGSENSKLAAIGKAAAVTTATIDGVVAVQKALGSAPPPVNFALAAAVGAQAAANVAKIASAKTPGFAFGGDFAVGGTGGTDSQQVSFRATPGETVSVRTPTQNRAEGKGDAAGAPAAAAAAPRIVNVLDPALVGDFLSTSEGEQVLMNVIRQNSDSMRSVLAEG